MARVLFLLCFLLVCPLLTHAASCEQAQLVDAEIQKVTQEKNLWVKRFGPHVDHDLGYQGLLDMMDTSHITLSPDGLSVLCAYFSELRCATCYAMALNPDMDSSVFLEALSQCHNSEIYQVFIAVDSYHKGKTPTKNAFSLKKLTLNILSPDQDKPAWMGALAHNGHEHIFSRQFYWLDRWAHNQKDVALDLQTYTNRRFDLQEFIDNRKQTSPYYLHHLNVSNDLTHIALHLIPTPDTIQALTDFSLFIEQNLLPFDPHKHTLVDALRTLCATCLQASQPSGEDHDTSPEMLKSQCSLLIGAIWNFLQTLHAPITPLAWEKFQDTLLKYHCVRYACTQDFPWYEENVLAHRALIVDPFPPTTRDYCFQNHIPPVEKKLKDIVDNFCDFVNIHGNSKERAECALLQEEAHADQTLSSHELANSWYSASHEPATFFYRKDDILESLSTCRCDIVLRLISADPVNPHWSLLYTTCTFPEKKALALRALELFPQGSRCRNLLTEVGLSEATHDLGRFVITPS